MIYLDSSAILEMVRHEPESEALEVHLDAHPDQDLITSALATVEVVRARVALCSPDIAGRAVTRSDRIELPAGGTIAAIAMIAPVLDLARTVPASILRSLDAIRVATATLLDAAIDHVITYDKRMLAAADAAGLRTAAPS